MTVLRLFGPVRDIAGVAVDDLPGNDVAAVIEAAVARYGERFSAVLPTCRIWVNGVDAEPSTRLGPGDEVAVLPPVSGG